MSEPARQPANPAEMYERYFVPAMFLPWAKILLRHAALQPGERVLDVACGTGVVARHAAPLVGEHGQVVGVDLNPAMLEVAQSLSASSDARIEWRQGDAMALPVPAGVFDVVLCQQGVQFFPNRVCAMQEMRRVLAPGGRVVVTVWQTLAQHPVFEALMQSVARHLALPPALVTIPFGLWDAQELRDVFGAAGCHKADIVAESSMVRFPEADRFVPLAVTSSAAAVPAFAQLDAMGRSELLERVRADTEPVLRQYREADSIVFPMFANVAMATL